MKAGLITIAALSAVAVAQPHHRHQHPGKRDVVVETEVDTAVVTAIEYVTATAAAVYVDQFGNRVAGPEAYWTPPTEAASVPAWTAPAAAPSSESSSAAPAPAVETSTTPAAAPATVASSSAAVYVPAYTAPTSEAAAAPSSYAAASSSEAAAAPSSYAAATSSSAAASSSSAAASSGGSGYGITYSPYNADGTCKSTSQVKTDVSGLSGYSLIRLYGVDCNQVANVLAALSSGQKLFTGVYDITQTASELATLISAAKGNWAAIDTVAIGNEGINGGTYSVGAVSAAVTLAKGVLSAAGYTGSVVTVDTFIAIINNPALCNVGDYVAANAHAFFDGGYTADKAGDFAISAIQRVSAACGGKKTVLTESGWPSSGETNQKAIPSSDNQKAAVSSLKSAFSDNLILFTAYNDYWKKDSASTFGAEKYWGIGGNSNA